MDHTTHFDALMACLALAATDLFAEGYGTSIEFEPVDDSGATQGAAVMAVIGYGGPTLRGSLLLLTSEEVAAALEPEDLRSGKPSEDTLRDIVGELCNLLMGRLKNLLLARQVAPQMSTPLTVYGRDLQLPRPPQGNTAWRSLTGEHGCVYVRLDAMFEASFELAEPAARPSLVTEGDMLFF